MSFYRMIFFLFIKFLWKIWIISKKCLSLHRWIPLTSGRKVKLVGIVFISSCAKVQFFAQCTKVFSGKMGTQRVPNLICTIKQTFLTQRHKDTEIICLCVFVSFALLYHYNIISYNVISNAILMPSYKQLQIRDEKTSMNYAG